MLTIKNTNKIVGERIVNEWYIKSIQPYTTMHNGSKNPYNQYKIVIQNKISLSEGKIYLSRDFANGKYKRWYELSTTKGGKRSVQLITKDTIKDIKELLEHIKIVALD